MTQVARRQPAQARSRATVDAIVEAAAQVFERHGYGAGTTNRIAERAGVSIGSVYQYFDDKDAIVEAVTLRHIEDGAQALLPLLSMLADPEAAALEPEPALREVMRAMVDLHRDRPRLHRLLFEEAPLTDAVRDRALELEAGAGAVVAGWLARRPSPPRSPELTASLLVGAVEAWAHRFVIHPPDAVDEDAFLDEAARLLAAGL